MCAFALVETSESACLQATLSCGFRHLLCRFCVRTQPPDNLVSNAERPRRIRMAVAWNDLVGTEIDHDKGQPGVDEQPADDERLRMRVQRPRRAGAGNDE